MNDDTVWIPAPRSTRTGHRVSIGPYSPLPTRQLSWRWKLAEYPMRWLARSMAKAETIAEMQGEEYTGEGQIAIKFGTAIREQAFHHYQDEGPQWPTSAM